MYIFLHHFVVDCGTLFIKLKWIEVQQKLLHLTKNYINSAKKCSLYKHLFCYAFTKTMYSRNQNDVLKKENNTLLFCNSVCFIAFREDSEISAMQKLM